MKNIRGLVAFLVTAILLITFAFYAFQVIYTPNVLVEQESRVIVIPQEGTFKDVQNMLYEGRFVNDLVSFSFLAKLMKYDKNIKPGRYVLLPDMTNLQAIRLLRSGKREPVNITFHNIRLLKELAPKITKNLVIGADEFNAALVQFISENDYGFNAETTIAMFLPNTYEMYYTSTAEEVIQRMYREYDAFWNEERKAKATALNLTPIEVSTLASIVQAETIKNEEKPRVAGLYLNRLRQGIALQADPTLKYALGDFTIKRVLNEHKEVDSPYNTYRNAGLPPGPINMPTIGSIEAVLNYEKHEYVYMCAKEDFSGYHNFAVSYKDHLVNARKYQRQLTIEQQKAAGK